MKLPSIRQLLAAVAASRRKVAVEWRAGETVERKVDPRETDPRLRKWVEPHGVHRCPGVPANGHLFLFLAGSFGVPGRQNFLLRTAAAEGFHAINLRYPNTWTIGGRCRNVPAADCQEKLRLHICEGIPSGLLPGVAPWDAIQSRLSRLLGWLAAEHPAEGWSDFLVGETVRWDRTVVAGHSQGGGHALLLGKRHAVRRVVLLGAPADGRPGRVEPADWIGCPGCTPAERTYGFVHRRDPGYDRIVAAWAAAGLARFGAGQDVDRGNPPYAGSHQLVSHACAPHDNFHASVATDGATPRLADGSPLFRPVWQSLLDLTGRP